MGEKKPSIDFGGKLPAWITLLAVLVTYLITTANTITAQGKDIKSLQEQLAEVKLFILDVHKDLQELHVEVAVLNGQAPDWKYVPNQPALHKKGFK